VEAGQLMPEQAACEDEHFEVRRPRDRRRLRDRNESLRVRATFPNACRR
jgi:hypothetical protein